MDKKKKPTAKKDYFIDREGMPPGFVRINFDFGGNYEKQFGKRTKPKREEQDGNTE
jgi:hypothetical protein